MQQLHWCVLSDLQLYLCYWNPILLFLYLTRLASDSVEPFLPWPWPVSGLCFLSLAHMPELTLPITACSLTIFCLPSMPACDRLLPTHTSCVSSALHGPCWLLTPARNLLACQRLPLNLLVFLATHPSHRRWSKHPYTTTFSRPLLQHWWSLSQGCMRGLPSPRKAQPSGTWQPLANLALYLHNAIKIYTVYIMK